MAWDCGIVGEPLLWPLPTASLELVSDVRDIYAFQNLFYGDGQGQCDDQVMYVLPLLCRSRETPPLAPPTKDRHRMGRCMATTMRGGLSTRT